MAPPNVNAVEAIRHNPFRRVASTHCRTRVFHRAGKSLLGTMHKMEVLRRVSLSAALLTLLAAPGRAQTPQPQLLPEVTDDLHMNEPLQARFDRRGLIEPIQIGPFQLSLLTQFDFAFNDNIYAQTANQKSDFFFDLGLKAMTTYRYEDFSAELDTYFLDHQFLRYTTENFWETNDSLTLREAPRPDFSYFLTTGLARLAVPRTDPNPINGKTPATYLLYTGTGGVTIGSGLRNLLTLSVGIDKTEFDQIQGLNGLIDATARNRTEVFGDFRFDHVFFGQQKVFVELRPNTRNYDQAVDPAGFRQASNGGRIDTGVQLEPNGAFLITVATGWQQQEYNDPRFGSIGEPDATVEVQWSPTLLTQLDAKYIHEYSEDINAAGEGTPFSLGGINSPGYTHDQAIFTLQHELRRDFLATMYVSDDYRELEGSPRRYQVLDIGPRLQYRLPSEVTLGFSYDREELHSNGPVNYGDDIAMFTVKKQF